MRATTERRAEKTIDLIGWLRQIARVLAAPQCSDNLRLHRARPNEQGRRSGSTGRAFKPFHRESPLHMPIATVECNCF